MRRRTLLGTLARVCGGLEAGRLLNRTDWEISSTETPPDTGRTSPEAESPAAPAVEEAAARTSVRELARRLSLEPRVRAVGDAYLEFVPNERAVELLLDRLMPAKGALSDAGHTMTALDVRIRADYRSAEVVEIEGWQLSRTEARLFGLASLLDAGADG